MSSPMDAVGSAVGGAGLGGLALGLAWQQSQNADAGWQGYAKQMEEQVRQLQVELAAAQFAAANGSRALGECDRQIDELNMRLRNYETALEQANRKLQITSAELNQRSAKLSSAEQELMRSQEKNTVHDNRVETLNRLIDLMVDKRLDLERALTRQSANTHVINKLYSRLVEEIGHVGNSENFESLDPEYLIQAITEEWQEYEETGEMVYRPRIKVLSEDQQEQGFGGAEATDHAEKVTRSTVMASLSRL
jgi:chromosome segregation ATPase